MNTSNTFTRIAEIKKLWELLIPELPAPEDSWLARWDIAYGEEVVKYAILRTRSKNKGGFFAPTDADKAHRYTGSVCKNHQEDLKAKAIATNAA
jgi:hypothetical protein